MSKITTFPNMENEDKNMGISPNTEFNTGSIELNKPEDLTACPSCGSQNLAGSNFCIVCGCRLNRPSSDSPAFHASQVSFAEFTSDRGSVNMFKEGNTRLLSEIPSANTDKSNGSVSADCDELVPALIRIKNGEKTVIEKSLFKIGTSRESCDMVITDNRYISRIHAYIVTRNGRYFIIDRNSTNKTYVDGNAIPAETEVELFDNTSVKLANEDMMFNIDHV